MKIHPLVLLSVIASLALSACNFGVPAPQSNTEVATAAALTVEAALTGSAPLATATLDEGPPAGAPGFAPTETPVPGVAIDGTTAEPANCEDIAQITKWEREFVSFDKAESEKPLEPGKIFSLSLELKNSSNCLWTHQYRVKYESGTRLHIGPDIFPFIQTGFTVKPGESYPLNMQLYAPTTPGTFEATYSVINADGEAFLTFGIPGRVGSPNTGGINAPGNLRYEYSCVPGTVTITLNWTDESNNENGFRIYRDGAQVADIAADSTRYDDILSTAGSYNYTVAAYNTNGESYTSVLAETSNCK